MLYGVILQYMVKYLATKYYHFLKKKLTSSFLLTTLKKQIKFLIFFIKSELYTSLLRLGIFFFLSFLLLLLILGPLPRHMEVPRLGVELELQPSDYATATATQHPSRICNLHDSSRQRQILNPLSKARARTHNLMVPSRIR